ncbi:HAMP domain-containing histidine kinase [Fulvivirga maritima]|uniref:sensor histidine kinase n=1 Tax=Fulvivirga maritima TaxID=2904247 RepID=UPI001F3CA6A6|nr:HAMP domain-containing sensor histidine kinase [Fulvivirga maritima]UII28065.1 HAMP domain-containing histidine kinase [Fulvivirga maritima]
MKKHIIWIVISLMSVALIGLTSFQVYWINNAIKLNQKQFEQKVQQSLQLVSQRLEKKDAYDFTHNILRVYPGVVSQNTLRIGVPTDGTNEDSSEVANPSYYWGHHAFWFNIVNPDMQAENQLLRKSEMINVVVEEMFGRKRSIHERVNPEVLESMLDKEFFERGIELNYDFAVWNPYMDSVLYTNTNNSLNTVKHSPLRARLFPNDILGNTHYLTVNFPDESAFLFREIWATLATSVVFILLIIGCFTYAIYTIIRQKKLSEMKNDFINNMTHELKTPIATVGLACEALHEKEMRENDGILLRYLDVIKDENNRLATQVEKVLQSALLDKPSFQLKNAELQLHDLIENVVSKIRVPLESKNGEVELNLKASNDIIQGDYEHLSHVVLNLLDNAMKYSPAAPLINISSFNIQDGIIIEISDHGKGMKQEELKRIFDKFYRVHTGDRHDVKGFGLGLSYVKSIVNMHGGDISVRSVLDQGSTFSIFLPFKNGE